MTITLPESIYRRIVQQAQARKVTPADFLAGFLDAHLSPQHPHVERVQIRGGQRAVVKGTRTGIETVLGYRRAGYTPEQIASDLLPHLDLAQVYDALSYYEDYREEIDAYIADNSPEIWRTRIVEEIGEKEAKIMLGEE